jgi:hypothetical protein
LASVGVIICAIAAGFVFVVTRGPVASDEAMLSLKTEPQERKVE